MLLVWAERQFRRVKDGRIIEAPLQDIIGDEARGANGSVPRFHNCLLAVGQDQRALLVCQADPAVDDRQGGKFSGGHGHDKLRAFHAGDGPMSNNMKMAGCISMKRTR